MAWGGTPKLAELKGAMIFEKDITQPVLINPHYALFHKTINMQPLVIAADTARLFVNVYRQFCNEVLNTIESNNTDIDIPIYSPDYRYFVTDKESLLTDAPNICEKHNYYLPEIHSLEDYNQLSDMATLNDIGFIMLGQVYNKDTKQYHYVSNNLPIIKVISYLTVFDASNKTPNFETIMPLYDPMAQNYSLKHHKNLILMGKKPNRKFVLLTSLFSNTKFKIICQKTLYQPFETYQNNILLQMTAHACRRDLPDLLGSTNVISKELEHFKVLQLPGRNKRLDKKLLHCQEVINNLPDLTHKFDIIYKALMAKTLTLNSVTSDLIQRYIIFKLLGHENAQFFMEFLLLNSTVNWPHQFYSKSDHSTAILSAMMCNFESKYIYDQSQFYTVENAYNILEIAMDDHNVTKLFRDFYTELYTFVQHKHKRATVEPTFYETPQFSNTYSGISDWGERVFSGGNFKTFNLLASGISANSRTLGDLNINQQELLLMQKRLNNETSLLKKIARMNEHALITMFSEIDAKVANYRVQNLITQALLKLAQSMSMAFEQKTSPYVLSPTELERMATHARTQKQFLSSNIDEVITTLARTPDAYVFSFAVPVIDDTAKYRIYNVRKIPIFKGNLTFTLLNDISHLAISTDTTRYIELTRKEYDECLKLSFCRASGAPIPLTDKSGCTALSHRYNTIACPMAPITHTYPFFATYANTTYFSVPDNYLIETICPNTNSDTLSLQGALTGSMTISGIGHFQINANCFAKLPDGRIIENVRDPGESVDLGQSTITEILDFAPKILNFTFNNRESTFWQKWNDTPIAHQLDIKPFQWTHKLEEIFNPGQMSTFMARNAVIIIILIILLIIFFLCYPRFRLWLKTVTLWSNPKKYWTKYKNYNVPYFDKLPKINQQLHEKFNFVKFHEWLTNMRHYNNSTQEDIKNKQDIELKQMFEETSFTTNRPIIKATAPLYSSISTQNLYPPINTGSGSPVLKRAKSHLTNAHKPPIPPKRNVVFEDQIQTQWRQTLAQNNIEPVRNTTPIVNTHIAQIHEPKTQH